jgi:flagellum-specific ATP synthase
MVSLYNENRDLMLLGGYISGQDSDLDEAVSLWPRLVDYIRQDPDDRADINQSAQLLASIVGSV